jgi:hypothetical protein
MLPSFSFATLEPLLECGGVWLLDDLIFPSRRHDRVGLLQGLLIESRITEWPRSHSSLEP